MLKNNTGAILPNSQTINSEGAVDIFTALLESLSEKNQSNTSSEAMITTERNRQTSTSTAANSSRIQTNNSSRFFKRPSFSFTALRKLLPFIFHCSTNIKNQNLKTQLLCLYAKIDMHLLQYAQENDGDTFAALLHALQSISDNKQSISKTLKAHIYFTTACYLNRKGVPEHHAFDLYRIMQETNTQSAASIAKYFLNAAKSCLPTIETQPFTKLVCHNLRKLEKAPYINKEDVDSNKKSHFKPEVWSIIRTLNPLDKDKADNIKHIMQQSIDEMIEYSLNELDDHTLQHLDIMTCLGIARTILILSTLGKVELEQDYNLAITGTLNQIKAKHAHDSAYTLQKSHP